MKSLFRILGLVLLACQCCAFVLRVQAVSFLQKASTSPEEFASIVSGETFTATLSDGRAVDLKVNFSCFTCWRVLYQGLGRVFFQNPSSRVLLTHYCSARRYASFCSPTAPRSP
jgi:hypothetical protein